MIKRKIYGFFMAATACAATVSCGLDESGGDIQAHDEGAVTLSIDLRAGAAGQDSVHEQGSGYENYIDFAGDDFRIYFFTNDAEDGGNDRFLARFEPSDVTAVGGSRQSTVRRTENGFWAVTGKVPKDVLDCGRFKIVILANWGTYGDDSLVSVAQDSYNATTIDEISAAEWACYEIGDGFLPGPGSLIPLFGVQDYSDVGFSSEGITVLSSPVSLLRAMAKVEVTLKTHGKEIQNVRICRYNSMGMCAPAGVHDGGYVTRSGGWTLSGISLRGGKNEVQGDSGEDGGMRRMEMHNVVAQDEADEDDGIYQKWIAYVPEYDNSGEDYSFIEVITDDSVPRRIFFAEYSDGATTAYDGGSDRSGRLDIQRNRLYRFTAEFTANVFSVQIDRWDDIHENDFVFQGS